MRVIAGRLGGRHFNAPHGHRTHPMSDKMRGALFGVLGDIEDLTALDAFAGSGALGFEALSRGAKEVTLIDNDTNAQRTIHDNIAELGLKKSARLIKAHVGSWSDNNSSAQFSLVLCDPPYDKLQLLLLQKLVRHIAGGGTYVLSWPGKLTLPELVGLKIVQQKSYGDSQLVFYQKTG